MRKSFFNSGVTFIIIISLITVGISIVISNLFGIKNEEKDIFLGPENNWDDLGDPQGPLQTIDTSVDTIIPYNYIVSSLNIIATSMTSLNNIVFYYYLIEDNIILGGGK